VAVIVIVVGGGGAGLAWEGVDEDRAEAPRALQGPEPEREPRFLGGRVAHEPWHLFVLQLDLCRQDLEGSDHLVLAEPIVVELIWG
jgi:hypothetical protein